ncbi:hypothetical protein CAPTEDRAFT_221387 [Capitella teleta]|uniref:Peptidase C51 domain-containing protein n=1 Tax=Capitella teleta TaxID=283909 RepID=R7UGX2_CAPTE|nr:hypothetical protein CAPTEDRAFT_221387 [Capitella teleta]|eukprot:ELU05794.1 hypothetical protein CAPTEDRAFT_221387 [Capitella teleta]
MASVSAVALLLLLSQFSFCFDLSRQDTGVVAKYLQLAHDNIGSTTWSKASSHYPGSGKYKCNVFVADLVTLAGGRVPQIHFFKWSPIGTGEWCNPRSKYMKQVKCWQHQSTYKIGDVACFRGHMGFVTGVNLTTSANEFEIVRNDWGFRAGQNPVFWRWNC